MEWGVGSTPSTPTLGSRQRHAACTAYVHRVQPVLPNGSQRGNRGACVAVLFDVLRGRTEEPEEELVEPV